MPGMPSSAAILTRCLKYGVRIAVPDPSDYEILGIALSFRYQNIEAASVVQFRASNIHFSRLIMMVQT